MAATETVAHPHALVKSGRTPLILIIAAVAAFDALLLAMVDGGEVMRQLGYRVTEATGIPYTFLVIGAAAGLLGLVSGVIGSFAVLRRRALVGDAASHAALPGICLAFLVVGQRDFVALMIGALISGLLGVMIINWLTRNTRLKSDAAIGIVLSTFFGLGIALQRFVQNQSSTGKHAGLDSYLLGRTAGMSVDDLFVILMVSLHVLVLLIVLYKEFRMISFDTGFAASQGWPVLTIDLVLMGAIVVTVVTGLAAVGVVLMAALLILPGVSARFWTDRLGRLLWLAGAFGLVTGVVGSVLSNRNADLAAGPLIVLTGAAIFLFSLLAAPRRGAIARVIERWRLERIVARQNLLRTMWELDRAQPVTLDAMLRVRAWHPGHARRLLRREMAAGFVEVVDGGWHLTPRGQAEAARVVGAHRIQELLLTEYASGDADIFDRDARQVGKMVPPDLIRELEDRLRRDNRWPLGPASLLDPAGGGA